MSTKLGIKPGHRLVLIGAPPEFERELQPLPEGVCIGHEHGAADVAVAFFTQRLDVHLRFAELAAGLDPAGGLWIAWPKKSSGVATDLNENVVREIGLEAGLVDNKVCAVDETWSGLRFVYRLKDRPKHQSR